MPLMDPSTVKILVCGEASFFQLIISTKQYYPSNVSGRPAQSSVACPASRWGAIRVPIRVVLLLDLLKQFPRPQYPSFPELCVLT